MTSKPLTIDEYLAGLPAEQRDVLQALRETIQNAAPEAEECISYGMPTFKQDGMLLSFAAWKTHCALYGWGSATQQAFEQELAGYKTSKGTIQFPVEKPLPKALVRKLVKARVQENQQRAAGKKSPTAARTRTARSV